ncbi:MAG: hypothetical protein IIY58_06555 [Aeriscardovia sp.]|nr:hypothetical protein [Aeriscardovia sp.]
MEKITKHQHIFGDYVIEEIQECRYGKADLWIGKVGEEAREYIGTDWNEAMAHIPAAR